MDRREHLKLLFAGSLGAGLFFTSGCEVSEEEREESRRILNEGREYRRGYTPEELERDQRLQEETFFDEHEMRTVEVLSDLIIPADDVSGSATDAGVPDFIEFIMKDYPPFQLPVRGGLMWLDRECRREFGDHFIDCSESDQIEMLDRIAWPEEAAPKMAYGVRFFNRMRDLVATGFFTSEMGFEDLGYQGNTPNVWDGIPDHVLEEHGMAYDEKILEESIHNDERNRVAEWDEEGNLIR
jgi:gluconate 2-dehydrogenase gamma chain